MYNPQELVGYHSESDTLFWEVRPTLTTTKCVQRLDQCTPVCKAMGYCRPCEHHGCMLTESRIGVSDRRLPGKLRWQVHPSPHSQA